MIISALLLIPIFSYCHSFSYRTLVQDQWQEYKLEHNKIYHTKDEEQYRMQVFMDNMHTILEHNKLYELGAKTYKMGMNKFGDLTDEEFRRIYMPYNSSIDEVNRIVSNENVFSSSTDSFPDVSGLPKELDWRSVGAVTEVKDQGDCGSCYAFSATGSLEAQHYFKSKKLVSLSEQNIVDCTYKRKKYNNNGCLGGRVDMSFQYIIDNGGIDLEDSYPYLAKRSRRCLFKYDAIGSRMSKFVNIPKNNETELQKAVAKVGPISIMVDAKKMRFYSGGIFYDETCSSKEYTHGMLAVGYGSYKQYDYWILKNSWGHKWGEFGYMLLMRNKDNHCAVASAALYPVI